MPRRCWVLSPWKTDRASVRVITSTNADMEQKVRERKFREDLYYRLNILRLVLPGLRGTAPGWAAGIGFHEVRDSKPMTKTILANGSSQQLNVCLALHAPMSIEYPILANNFDSAPQPDIAA
jgi:sigma54-dependent transcription regulator